MRAGQEGFPGPMKISVREDVPARKEKETQLSSHRAAKPNTMTFCFDKDPVSIFVSQSYKN